MLGCHLVCQSRYFRSGFQSFGVSFSVSVSQCVGVLVCRCFQCVGVFSVSVLAVSLGPATKKKTESLEQNGNRIVRCQDKMREL